MYWRSDGIVLKIQDFSEDKAIVQILTEKGKWSGMMDLVSGRSGKQKIDISAYVDVGWSARIDGNLGKWTIYDVNSLHIGGLFKDHLHFLIITHICGLCARYMPERGEAEKLFHAVKMCIENDDLLTLIAFDKIFIEEVILFDDFHKMKLEDMNLAKTSKIISNYCTPYKMQREKIINLI